MIKHVQSYQVGYHDWLPVTVRELVLGKTVAKREVAKAVATKTEGLTVATIGR
ncbi:TPA: hypothetical protein SML50_001772 [Serratia fonticola]|nr:hypothetical protein [Serratia fonticola]